MATDPGARFPTGRAWLAALRALAPVVPSDAPGPAGGPGAGAVPGGAAPGAAPIAAGVVRAGTAADGRAATPPARPVPPRPVPPGAGPPGPGPAPAGPGPAPPGPGPALPGDDDVARDHPSVVGPGSPAGGPPPPAGTPPAPGRRKAIWPLFAGILAALAVIAAIAVIAGRGGGSSPSAVEPTLPPAPAPAPASSVPGSTVPSGVPPTTSAPVSTAPLSGAAAWFAAASGPTCRPAVAAEKLPGTISAVTCTYPGVVAVFAQVGSPVDAELFLARLRRNHTGATAETWASGRAVLYGSAAQPAIGWDYAGEPYAALALSNNRTTLSTWWVATGRVDRTTA